MSVIVTGRIKVDPERLEKAFQTHKQTLIDISDDAKSRGATHHQFAAGDGEVVIVDEWPDEATFQSFFAGQPDIQKVMADVGVTELPSFEVFRQLDSPDKF